jgi:hypothetical protein
MNLELLFISLYGIGALFSFVYGTYQTYLKKNPYGLTPALLPYGIFVWGDAVLIGGFWTIASLAALYSQSVFLFLVTQAVYWMVRSAGEVMYWFLQQFAETKRDAPDSLFCHNIFPGEAIWFAYQVYWQIVLVISVVGLIFLLR